MTSFEEEFLVPEDMHLKRVATTWDQYANDWNAELKRKSHALSDKHRIEFLGDEWSGEGERPCATNYGLPDEITQDYDGYVYNHLIRKFLPESVECGLEIGPGGGRFTKMLVNHCESLHLIDVSTRMLEMTVSRLPTSRLVPHLISGDSFPNALVGKCGFCVSLDVLVHFEPRYVFLYLQEVHKVLIDGGLAVLHLANSISVLGWKQFLVDFASNKVVRSNPYAFGVMSPDLAMFMAIECGFDILTIDLQIIPRDLVLILRRKS